MSLIKSISGIRGTIGGMPGSGLTPPDIVRFVTGYATFISRNHPGVRIRIVLGRDARISGEMVNNLVAGTLMGMGADVIDIGLTTTPTAEMAVVHEGAHGGIILTASHNPKQWNALKLLNHEGEFLSAGDGEQVLALSASEEISYAEVQNLGTYVQRTGMIDYHISRILELPLVDKAAIRAANFKVAVDAVNSTGGIAVPALLKALGVQQTELLFCDPTGDFPHNPEPLPEHLADICATVVKSKSHLGLVVDPDVDRLAIINELGEPIGEEYTLVAVADYILSHKKGNTVSNLSSTQALADITEKAGGHYYASAVGEVNVVELMKKKHAVIGGEGNGGVIYPDLHYGRDALAGIALFLTHLAKSGQHCSMLRNRYPNYFISKNKISFSEEMNIEEIMKKLVERYSDRKILQIDGVKIHFDKEWVHLRRSNTEPIVRVYAESDMILKADNLAAKIISDVKEIIKG